MKKQTGSILLVAGTCIGSGMIALPMVLAKLGLIPSITLMIVIWAIMYYTSLINLELNLQAERGLSLGALGKHFSGPIAEIIGNISLKLLSYALLAVFIYGGSSVLQKLLDTNISFTKIETWYACIAGLLLLLPIKFLDYINRILFIGLLIVGAILVAGLTSMITWNDLPLISEQYQEISAWITVIPIVFTSFGFQVIFHTLTNYCNKDAKVLKKSFFWGSLIPAFIYVIWTSSVLSVVHHESPDFYRQIIAGTVEVGDLIKELSHIARWQSVQLLVWWISLLAIFTSVLGVGVGLCDSLKTMLTKIIPDPILRNIVSSTITILPAYIVAALVPNAFITVLGFAGMILVVIAILLPVYLLIKANPISLNYSALRYKSLISLSVLTGVIIMCCEIINMITR